MDQPWRRIVWQEHKATVLQARRPRQEALFAGHEAAAVPLLIGTTARDAPGFFPPRDDPFSYFGSDAESAAKVFNPGGALLPEEVLVGIAPT